jgi:hypothetical protein
MRHQLAWPLLKGTGQIPVILHTSAGLTSPPARWPTSRISLISLEDSEEQHRDGLVPINYSLWPWVVRGSETLQNQGFQQAIYGEVFGRGIFHPTQTMLNGLIVDQPDI